MPDLPHFHPPLVHFPIAFLLLGSICGLLYLHWQPRPTLRQLTWWPLLVGWASVLVAILSGLLDQRTIAPQAPFRSVLNQHIGSGVALWVLYGLLLYRQWLFGTANRRRARASAGLTHTSLLDEPAKRWWLTGLLLVGMVLVLLSGWNGGRLVFEWGVNVGP